jgi:toxin HigB-1
VIRSFRSKGLQELFETDKTAAMDKKLHARCLRRLDALNAAKSPQGMNVPGFNFHELKGFKPTRYTVHVNEPWCITFTFEDGGAQAVDFEQYH